jgi:hypothetical protein
MSNKKDGLTIIEAIKSGKRFRRKGWILFKTAKDIDDDNGLLVDDIFATDYEIEEPKPKVKVWRAENGNLYFREDNVFDSASNYNWTEVTKELAIALKESLE